MTVSIAKHSRVTSWLAQPVSGRSRRDTKTVIQQRNCRWRFRCLCVTFCRKKCPRIWKTPYQNGIPQLKYFVCLNYKARETGCEMLDSYSRYAIIVLMSCRNWRAGHRKKRRCDEGKAAYCAILSALWCCILLRAKGKDNGKH